jgi:hypothetical protein
MKLREKFETKSSIDTTKEARVFASECEKIADEFAIGFAEFLEDKDLYLEKLTIIDALEIYKKEKGL